MVGLIRSMKRVSNFLRQPTKDPVRRSKLKVDHYFYKYEDGRIVEKHARDPLNLLTNYIIPVSKWMGMHSVEAEILMMMIAMHESGGMKYRKQVGGPALGLYQMEPNTFYDVKDRYLAMKNPRIQRIRSAVCSYRLIPEERSDLDELVANDEFATAVARVYLWMKPEALPKSLGGLADYAKRHWNGPGKATAKKYKDDLLTHFPVELWTDDWLEFAGIRKKYT